MGIHTGRPTLGEAGYVGIAVHAAARICAAGAREIAAIHDTKTRRWGINGPTWHAGQAIRASPSANRASAGSGAVGSNSSSEFAGPT